MILFWHPFSLWILSIYNGDELIGYWAEKEHVPDSFLFTFSSPFLENFVSLPLSIILVITSFSSTASFLYLHLYVSAALYCDFLSLSVHLHDCLSTFSISFQQRLHQLDLVDSVYLQQLLLLDSVYPQQLLLLDSVYPQQLLLLDSVYPQQLLLLDLVYPQQSLLLFLHSEQGKIVQNGPCKFQ